MNPLNTYMKSECVIDMKKNIGVFGEHNMSCPTIKQTLLNNFFPFQNDAIIIQNTDPVLKILLMPTICKTVVKRNKDLFLIQL